MSFRHNVYTVSYAASSRSRRSFSPLARVATDRSQLNLTVKVVKLAFISQSRGKRKVRGERKVGGERKKSENNRKRGENERFGANIAHSHASSPFLFFLLPCKRRKLAINGFVS